MTGLKIVLVLFAPVIIACGIVVFGIMGTYIFYRLAWQGTMAWLELLAIFAATKDTVTDA